MLVELNDRARAILSLIVEGYLESGEATGSRTLSRLGNIGLSSASIRNTMADLEDLGLLFSPHTSAGRLPTALGLRFYIDVIMEQGKLGDDQRQTIETQCQSGGRSLNQIIETAGLLMADLSRCAGLVLAPKQITKLRHIEFVPIGDRQALVVMVAEQGMVENRLISLPQGLTPHILAEAGRYLSNRLQNRPLEEVRRIVSEELATSRTMLDSIAASLIEQGLASWQDISQGEPVLVVRGQSHLLEQVQNRTELDQIRNLMNALEEKENILRLLESTDQGEGVQIFIGAETRHFGTSDCAMVMAPYRNPQSQAVGAIGVIGPLRMNYAKIIPIVDYTAEVMTSLIAGGGRPNLSPKLGGKQTLTKPLRHPN